MKTKELIEKQIFDLIDSIGEILEGDYHIIDTKAEHPIDVKEGSYKVYHSKGYCIDVFKEYVCEPEEISQYDEYRGKLHESGFSYGWFAEWDGFDKVKDSEHLFKLIQSWTK